MKSHECYAKGRGFSANRVARLALLVLLTSGPVAIGQTEAHEFSFVSFEGFDAECCWGGDCISGTNDTAPISQRTLLR